MAHVAGGRVTGEDRRCAARTSGPERAVVTDVVHGPEGRPDKATVHPLGVAPPTQGRQQKEFNVLGLINVAIYICHSFNGWF